jgi:hypothetical protein
MFDRNESKDVELTPEQAALELQLAGLGVAPLHVNRDRLMFEAGRVAGRAELEVAATLSVAGAPRWVWPSAAAILTAACLVLGAMLVWRGDTALVAGNDAKPQTVYTPGIETPIPAELREVGRLAVGGGPAIWSMRPVGGYLEKRFIALTRGVGELRFEGDGEVPFQPGGSTQPATARELLRELVPSPAPPTHSNS